MKRSVQKHVFDEDKNHNTDLDINQLRLSQAQVDNTEQIVQQPETLNDLINSIMKSQNALNTVSQSQLPIKYEDSL